MIVIFAEKEDMGSKIAAALDCIRLPSGKVVDSDTLPAYQKEVKKYQVDNGYLPISFFGEEAVVTWGLGHLYALKDVAEYDKALTRWASRPVCFIPKAYELHPISSDVERFAKKNDFQRKTVKSLFSKADKIINATDDDREGEVIFAYVYEAVKCKKPYERVRFTSTNKEDIVDAFKHLVPASEVKPVEMAGRARGIYDWLVGTNLTTQFTLKNPGNGVLSVGRVQTPVLKMIVDRENEIIHFKSSAFWSIKAKFTTDDTGAEYNGEHKTKRFDKKSDAETILSKITGKPGKITDIKKKTVKKEVPLLYSQTALQMDANETYGYTPKKTLDTCQWLYEQGYVTYPRTKSQVLNDGMESNVKAILGALSKMTDYTGFISGRPLNPGKKFFNSAKVDSHYAIIPTTKTPPVSLTTEQKNIYDLIAKSLIRTIYPEAIMESTAVTTTVEGEEFVSNGSVVVNLGWLAVGGKTKETLLPKLTLNETVTGDYKLSEGKTEPPKRYTDKTILAAMVSAGKDLKDEELRKILADPSVEGIGTDATRAGILQTLADRKYIEHNGKSILPTQKGMEFIRIFPVAELESAEFTARMEKQLTLISKKEVKFEDFIEEVEKQTDKWCHIVADSKEEMSSSSKSSKEDAVYGDPCPNCGKPMMLRTGKYGKFWGCTDYPRCKTIVKYEDPEKAKEPAVTGDPCPDCGAPMVLHEGKYGKFWGCSKFPECKKIVPYVDKRAIKCPTCGDGSLIQRKSRSGKTFWGCSNYPSCKVAFWDKPTNKKCPDCGAMALQNGSKHTKYKCSVCGKEFDK